jgi:superfamily II DNA or RNA helicase
MSELIKLAHNAITAKIYTENNAVKDLLSDTLSYYVEGVEHMKSFGVGRWDGRSSFFSRRTMTFPAGFVSLIHDTLISKGYRVQLIRGALPAPLGDANPIVDEFGNDDPKYDFQLQAMRQIERHGRGIIQVATGGGKSKIAKLIISRYRRMTLFLTTRGVLMYQMKDACEKAGFKVGVVGDGVFSPTRGVNVAMVQTIVAKLKEPKLDSERRDVISRLARKKLPLIEAEIAQQAQAQFNAKMKERARIIKLLEMFEVVIGEEAHEAGGNSYFEILRHCKNAHIRVALTATPFMRADAEDNMRLMAAFGPIVIQVSEETLINRGILATPYFKFVSYQPHPKLRRTSPWERAYKLGILEAEDRNARIVEYARKAIEHRLPVMILVQRTDHGNQLKQMISEHGKVVFLRGENNQDERKAALTKLGNGQINVLIGTTILDVGVDVPAVGMVILAGGGKAEVAQRQRIGRGLRSKKTGSNIAFIVDFDDDLNEHLRDHARQRKMIVQNTPGFAERILGSTEDFDWSLLSSFRAVA